MNFTVIDAKTGEYPDLSDIALHEEWAQDLMYCDMEGFAILEDGTLILMDECGRFTYCPEGRFQIVPDEPNEPLSWAELTKMYGEPVYIVVMGVCEYWALVKYAYNGGVYLAAVNDIDDYGSESLYGKTWLAYRRPPERQKDV